MEFERVADKKRTDFILHAVHQHTAPGSQVLDFGCGNGHISYALATRGFQVMATDVSEKTIAAAKAINAHPHISFQTIKARPHAETKRYQAIICSEVLEHLHDPSALLRTFHHCLAGNGVLVVTVPNGIGPRELLVTRPVQAMQRRAGRAWNMVSAIKRSMGYTGITAQSSAEDLQHLQFFTRKTLSKLASSTGFAITEWASANFIEQVFPYSLLTRRSQRLQRLDCRLADKLPLALSSGFMTVWKKC